MKHLNRLTVFLSAAMLAFAASALDEKSANEQMRKLWNEFGAASREGRRADAVAAIEKWAVVCRTTIDGYQLKTNGTPAEIARSRMGKCNRILELAARFNDQLGDKTRALAAVDEAIAMKDGDDSTRITAMRRKAEYLRRYKRTQDALKVAEETLAIALAHPEIDRLADAYDCRAEAHYAMKSWDRAVEDFIASAESSKRSPVTIGRNVYEAILWVTRSGRGDDSRRYLERLRAIPGLHINNYVRTYEIDGRTYNAEKRYGETLKLFDRVLADTNILAQSSGTIADVIITGAKLVKGCGEGYEATFSFYDRVIDSPKRYNLDDKALWKVADAYAGCCWRSMDRARIKDALALAKRLGHEYKSGMIVELDRHYDGMEKFPKDEKDIVIPASPRDLGFDPDRKVVKASSFGWNATNATDCLQAALDSDASTVIVDNRGSPWYIWSVTLKSGPCSNRRVVFEKGVAVLSAPEHNRKNEPGWYRMDMFKIGGCTNLWIEGEGEAAKRDTYIGKYRNRAERLAAGWEYGGNGFNGACRNTVVKNLYVANCGQDALCWGGKNSFVIDCVFDDNYRQGMSIGGGENCVYKNVTFCNTFGGEPHCGVDFEPYYEIYSCPHHYFFDCKFFNNASKNLIFATSTYAPMTAYFKRCQFEAQRNGNVAVLARAGIYMEAFCHAPSKIVFDECRIDGYSDGWGNPIQFLSTFLYDVTFRNCTINDRGCLFKGAKETASPIHLNLDRSVYDGFYPNAGIVTFENVKVNGYDNVPLVQVTDRNGKYGINTFRGTIDWNGKLVDMSKYSYMPPDRGLRDSPAADPARLEPAAGTGVAWTQSFEFPFGHSYYNPLPQYNVVASGEKGSTAEFTVRYHCRVSAEKPVTVTGLDGKRVNLGFAHEGEVKFAYTLPADGAYVFDFNVPSKLNDEEIAREGFTIVSASGCSVAYQAGETRLGRVAGLWTGDDFADYVGYFEVPGGKDCTIKVQGGGIELRDAEGTVVERIESNGDAPQFLRFKTDSGKSEIWSFTVLGGESKLKFFEPLAGIWADDPEWLPTLSAGRLPFHRVARARSSAAEMPHVVLFALPIRGAIARATDEAAAKRAEFAKGDDWSKKYNSARQHYDWMEPAMQRPDDLKAMAAELESMEPIRKMRDMQRAAKRESDDLRRYVAFVSLYAPVLALDDRAARIWAQNFSEPDDCAFAERINAVIGRFGAEWMDDGLYYDDYAAILKLAPMVVRRLDALGVNK